MSGLRRRIALGAMFRSWNVARYAGTGSGSLQGSKELHVSAGMGKAAIEGLPRALPASAGRFWEFGSAAQFVRSWLFRPDYYARCAGLSGAMSEASVWSHFMAEGWRSGFSPSPLFDVPFIRRVLVAAGFGPDADPFAVWDSGRAISPTPLFDAGWYLVRYPDVRLSGLDPFVHWSMWGVFEGRAPASFVELGALGEHTESLRVRRMRINGVTGPEDLLRHPDSRSCVNLAALSEAFGGQVTLDSLMSGEVPFMTDPQALFGVLGEWLPRNRESILGLESM